MRNFNVEEEKDERAIIDRKMGAENHCSYTPRNVASSSKNPMIQRSLGPKKFRKKGDSDSEDSDDAPKGATSVVHKGKGAVIEKTDQNATAVRNFDVEEEKDGRERKEKKHKSEKHEERRMKEGDRESSKKHKKSHKSSKDLDYPVEKKKKRKDRSKDREREGKEDRKRSRREDDEEDEIPGDWGEWYDQGGQGSSRDSYRGKHYEHDDRSRY